MIIDCGTCAVAGPACDDCVVSVLLGPSAASEMSDITLAAREEAEVVRLPVATVADEHAPAIAVLVEAGLIPPLRLVPRTEAS
jgi:ferredoxin